MNEIHSLTFKLHSDIILKKEGDYLRVTKDPEERRQEIINTAIRLFYENGYEKTSIADIANSINIAQGLCYRYFPSKEILFDTAIDQYADLLVNRMTEILKQPNLTLRQIILKMPTFLNTETDDGLSYKLCHGSESKKIHDQLSMSICRKMFPVVKKQLDLANERGEIDFPDTETLASFCIYGQLGILLRFDLSGEERIKRINTFLLELLQKF